MTSRLFVIPSNLGFVESVLDLLERFGFAETLVRTKSSGFVEIEALNWNLLKESDKVLFLGELCEMNVQYLIKLRK